MVKININLSNRWLYSILAVIIVILAGVAVYAWGGSDPPTMGHSAGELDLGPITIDETNGRVGIGAVNPGTTLVVSGGKILHEDGTAKAELFAASSTGKAYVGSYSNSPFVLRTNDQDRVTIDTTGQVGIGTSSPGAKLDVAGDVKITGNLDVESGMAVGASYSGTDTAPSNGLIVEGRVGIGTNDLFPYYGKLVVISSGNVDPAVYAKCSGLNCIGVEGVAENNIGVYASGEYGIWATGTVRAGNFVGEVSISDLNTGSNYGSRLCVDNSGILCKCDHCA